MKRKKKESVVSQHAWMAEHGKILRSYAVGITQAEAIRALAFRQRVTASAVVREAVRQYLENETRKFAHGK